MSSISSILGFCVALILFVGLPISVISLIYCIIKKKSTKKPKYALFSCIGLIVLFTAIGTTAWSQTDDYQEYLAQKEITDSEQDQEELKPKQNTSDLSEQSSESPNRLQDNNTQSVHSTEDPHESDETPDAEIEKSVVEIFHGEIGLNRDAYNGKEIMTTLKVSYCYEDGKRISTIPNLCYGSIEIYKDSAETFDENEYITVSGILNVENNKAKLLNSTVVFCGSEAQENYIKEETAYKNNFLEVAEIVSFDDLIRYPDTYKNKKIKIDVEITDVESDGIIFNGTIQAKTLDGNEIALEDYRENREPRLQKGDLVTVYGIGNGLSTVKVYDNSGIIPDKIDSYDIPGVYIQYVEIK